MNLPTSEASQTLPLQMSLMYAKPVSGNVANESMMKSNANLRFIFRTSDSLYFAR
jgi:hypothetical protein